ncbi:hypothetical protein GCM10018966_041090 [Streptomyces yanii]
MTTPERELPGVAVPSPAPYTSRPPRAPLTLPHQSPESYPAPASLRRTPRPRLSPSCGDARGLLAFSPTMGRVGAQECRAVNTLLVQEVLADPKGADKLTNADRRALSPLF